MTILDGKINFHLEKKERAFIWMNLPAGRSVSLGSAWDPANAQRRNSHRLTTQLAEQQPFSSVRSDDDTGDENNKTCKVGGDISY